MARRCFYSFHYKPDNARAAQVRNIGVIELLKASIKKSPESTIDLSVIPSSPGRSQPSRRSGEGHSPASSPDSSSPPLTAIVG